MIIIVIIRKWAPQESLKHSHNCIINGTPSEEEETHGGSYLRGKFRKDAEYRRHLLRIINQRFRIKSGILRIGGTVGV